MFEAIKTFIQTYVIDQGLVGTEWSWLTSLFATIVDFFEGLFSDS